MMGRYRIFCQRIIKLCLAPWEQHYVPYCSHLFFLVVSSSIVFCMLSVIVSAYMIAFPFKFRAALPTVWVSERLLRRNPSLSASKMATKDFG